MKPKKPFKLLAFPLVLAAPLAFAQAPPAKPSSSAYRVQFILTETQPNHPGATHAYTLLLAPDGGSNSVEVGTRVPVKVAPDKYDYQRVGVSLRCHLVPRPRGDNDADLHLMVDVNVSSADTGSLPGRPLIHSADTSVDTAVPLGKRVTVAQFGGLTSQASYQLDIVAEPAGTTL